MIYYVFEKISFILYLPNNKIIINNYVLSLRTKNIWRGKVIIWQNVWELLVMAKHWKQLKCTSSREWINKLWCAYITLTYDNEVMN